MIHLKVFSYFCFISYVQAKIEFSYDDLVAILKKVPVSKVSFKIDSYIDDLVNSLCVLYKDGINYKFAHRSFQEYFVSLFLKELSDETMKQISKQIIYKDVFRMSQDSVFDMLYDMAEERFEKNILLPILQDFEKDISGDKYDFYFHKLVHEIKFNDGYGSEYDKIVLWLVNIDHDDIIGFIYRYVSHYVERSECRNRNVQSASDKALKYLLEKKSYTVGTNVTVTEIVEDNELYELMRETWIGERVRIMSNLREKLKSKQEKWK